MTSLSFIHFCHSQSSSSRTQPRACTQHNTRAFWVAPETKSVLTTALETGIGEFLFTNTQLAEQCETLGRFSSYVVDEHGRFDGGRIAVITNANDVSNTSSLAGNDEIIVMDASDWRAIPAENLIAAFTGTPTRLFAMVSDANEAGAMLRMLDKGVDGVVLRTSENHIVRSFASLHQSTTIDKAEDLSTTRIIAISSTGVGERVCVDTCSLLTETEGLLVGSSSQCLGLVLSEAASCEYVPSRPFRVNAGAVHQYVAAPGGRTRYLCELSAGDEILAYDAQKRTVRTVVVGRAKVETRPLVLIQVEGGTLFVQNAETVRLATKHEAKSVVELSVGDEILVRTDNTARHIGMAVDEFIVEK